jgi:hypothetical protein
MVVFDIVTPDNLKMAPAARPGWRQQVFTRIVKPNTLFFWTGKAYHGDTHDDDGITVDLSGQTLKQINEDTWLLQPSNIEIKIDFQSVKLKFPGVSITQAIVPELDEGENEADAILDELRHFFDRLLIKQVGREVGMVNRIEFPDVLHREPGNNTVRTLHRNLNPNVKSVIASFLTGKRGSIGNQSRKLKENVVASLAPRSRKRHTRRSNRA